MQKTTKRILLIALAVVVLLSALYFLNDPLSYSQRKEIKEAWAKKEKHDVFSYLDIINRQYVCGMRYYGTYNDYVILFQPTQLAAITTKVIAGASFTWNTSFAIYGYRDGKFHNLSDLYDAGELSAEDIAKIAKTHSKYD